MFPRRVKMAMVRRSRRAFVKASILFTVVLLVFITSKYDVLSTHSCVNAVNDCQAHTMPSEMKDWFGKYDVPLTIHRDYILEPLNLCPCGVVGSLSVNSCIFILTNMYNLYKLKLEKSNKHCIHSCKNVN